MPTDSEVLAVINAAFGDVPKPDHFTNYTHCEECAEHDETLRMHDRDTLLVSHVRNPGWDPLCFTSPQGKAYYLPTLAKFALDPPSSQHGWYGDQLLFHLYADGAENEFIRYCNAAQRRAVAALLAHFVDTRASDFEALTREDELLRANEFWSSAA